ncbi:TIR domain-containing protein [Glaciibacter psychrotolerans]|uniref:Putative nucleotide-binding protein n=1 Tax=Glaciibacter psychrotolerans TaxID=670054 RepID=A0A7Z0EDU1_9MICO|nr:TIR domain-containing protein [Leifsonia psychrotolerans]NYJ19785.1 putative nucleotide-binding protein [Leifsonia psychrotolerans]
MFVENPNADYILASEEFKRLNEKVLEPRGVLLTVDGYQYTNSLPAPAPAHNTPSIIAAPPMTSTKATVNGLPPWPTEAPAPTPEGKAQRDPKSVFVVHGRDTRPVEVVRQYLHFLGLRMMTWSDAVNLTGKPQPHTYEIVKAGIVIFSPDDEARLKPKFADGKELKPEGQPRQNVTLEAGMAFATATEGTIFVQSERVRAISDIEGFNWVSLDGTWDNRKDLLNRLRNAGAAVNQANDNLNDALAGPFKITE